jgi:hypothetical protein
MSNSKFCCERMAFYIAEGVIKYDSRYDQYDLILEGAGDTQTLQKIDFCPWSGTKLPVSFRDRWFDELEAIGVDPMIDPIPEPYQNSTWRTK